MRTFLHVWVSSKCVRFINQTRFNGIYRFHNEVYGGDIPDVGEMEGDVNTHHPDVEMSTADDDAVKELDEMKKRLKEMEEEAAALREMQAKVEKEMGVVQAASQASREEVDTRSVAGKEVLTFDNNVNVDPLEQMAILLDSRLAEAEAVFGAEGRGSSRGLNEAGLAAADYLFREDLIREKKQAR